jgi:PAS domain S-box-containing protein
MRDEDKTKEQLLEELCALRAQRTADEEAERQAREAEALLSLQKQILEAVSTRASRAEVLEMLVRAIERQFDGGLCLILLRDDEGHPLRPVAAASVPPNYLGAIDPHPVGARAGSSGTAVFRGQPVVVADIATDPLWAGYDFRDAALAAGIRACCSSPIRIRDGRVVGTFDLCYRQSRFPDTRDIRLVEVATHLAAITVERKRAEELLRQSEGLLAEAQQLAHIGSWKWDLVSDTVVWSDEQYRIFGMKPQEMPMTFERVLNRIHSNDRATVQKMVDEAFRSRQPFECTFRAVHADGTARTVQCRGRLEFDADGKPNRMTGTVQDRNEWTRSEAALEESQRRFRAVFENALDAILLIDDTARFIDGNPAFCHLLGYSREELLLLTVWDVTPTPQRARIPELLSHFLSAGTQSGEYALLCKNGAMCEIEYHAVANFLPGLHLVVNRDITERRRAERTLQDSHNLLRAVIEGIPQAVYVKDVQGRYLIMNSPGARIIGKESAEVLGRDDAALFEPQTAQRIMETDRRVLERGEAETYEQTDTAMGIPRTYLMSRAPFRGAHGEVLGVIGIGQDITERKRSEEALEKYAAGLKALSRRLVEVQEEERRHLARELHDEIGQVLATISFQLHGAKGLAGAAAIPRLEDCGALLQRVGEQVRSLALELRPTMLDVLGLEATLRWLCGRHQQRTGCAVQVDAAVSGSAICSHLAIACFRLVQEALTNVARHASAQHVWIALNQSESTLELAVRDDGAGFDVLAAQEQAAQRGKLGLLGMAERVQLLSGSLHVESESGHGTLIRASFPMSGVPERSADTPE